jgi:hypothetical protein
MALRYFGMVEIIGCAAHHPQFLHHTPGSDVGGNSERDQFFQPGHVKRPPNDFPGALGCKPLSPTRGREPPSDLNARREVRGEPWDRPANETDKGIVLAELRRAESETMLLKIKLNLIHQLVAFFRRKRPGKEFHDARVCIYSGKRLPIGCAPAPQSQPLSFRYNHLSLRLLQPQVQKTNVPGAFFRLPRSWLF